MDVNLLKGRTIIEVSQDDDEEYLVLDDGSRIYPGYGNFDVLSVEEQQEPVSEEPTLVWYYPV